MEPIDDEGVPYVPARGLGTVTVSGQPYGLADSIQRDRERADEIESWQAEHRMIWDEIRRCKEGCERGPGDFDLPTWRHCLDHLAQLSEHTAYRPY